MSSSKKNLAERFRSSVVYRSVVRTRGEDSPRRRVARTFDSVWWHLYPARVPRALLPFKSTFRLGFISTVLFLLLLVTGVYLMFFYTPATTMAYGDMQTLRTSVGFGQLLRNIHRWAAHLMVLVVVLHLVRTFWDGAYKAPRQFNWVIGVALLVVTLGYSFTGYLLPWDQLSYWAITVGADLLHYAPGIGDTLRSYLLGGRDIGQATLLRFYVLHVAVFTGAFFALLAVHLWRVRKDGFALAPGRVAANPTPKEDERRPLGEMDVCAETARLRDPGDEVFTWPHLIVRHQVVALATIALAVAMGVAFEAPLRELANPNQTPNPAKAPWYFVGLQELLAHFDPMIVGVLVPAVLVGALVALPYVDRHPDRDPSARRLARALFVLVFGAFVVLTIVGAFFRGPGWSFVLPWEELYFHP